MTTVENKARQRRIVEEFINKGNTAVAAELVAEDYVGHDPSLGHEQGRASLIANITRLRTAFPDLEWTIEEQVAEGDKVACYLVWRGAHQGEFLGIPPTGKRVAVRCMGIDSFVDGQCKESWLLIDSMSLMQQLGVVPLPGQAR